MVTGGLEVAEEVALMNKGVSLPQVIRPWLFVKMAYWTRLFDVWISTQTDYVDGQSMEMVRQPLPKLLDSAGIDLFDKALGVHANPEGYNDWTDVRSAFNDIEHEDPLGGNHDAFDLKVATCTCFMGEREALAYPNDYLVLVCRYRQIHLCEVN